MTTLTATQQGHRVLLQLTPTATVTGIIRQDINGTAVVRSQVGAFPRTGFIGMYDAEAALVGVVTYTAGDAVVRLQLQGTTPWLVAPLQEGLAVELEQVTDYGAAQASLGTVHAVVDRRDPLVALGRLGTRVGALDIYCPDHAAARDRVEFLDTAGLVFLKTPDQPGMDMYFVPTGVRTRPADGAWMLSVDYAEVGRPDAPLDAWTLFALAAAHTTLFSVAQAYEDLDAVAINDRTGVVL